MVTQIYNGQAVYWQDFGLWWDGNCDPQAPGTDFDPIVSCLRHAGSGTHATFDIFMKGNGWGLGSPINQSAVEPIVWFNDGSSDLMKCVNALPGAIGYADCDQLVGSKAKTGQDFPYENVHAVKLDGIECKRAKIRNGEYPFYSANWNFWRSTDPEAGLIGDLIAYASDPDNLPVGKQAYWAAKSEMVFLKGSDTAWPVFVGASEPQVP
jgi:ABC-type phosphate transport system substrate-binding protein